MQRKKLSRKAPPVPSRHRITLPRWAGVGDKTIWDWVNLLVLPIILTIGGYWFAAEQDARQQQIEDQRAARAQQMEDRRVEEERKLEEQRAQVQREIEEQRTQDTALQMYLDQMSVLMLEKKLRSSEEDSEVYTLARARTITALGRLDPSHRVQIVQFLVEGKLVQGIEGKNPVISLEGANLGNIDAPADTNLSGAILSDANLSNALLDGADLSGADLSGADLTDANLSGAKLGDADLRDADLRWAVLNDANLHGVKLNGAELGETDLTEAVMKDADLRGAEELSEAYLSGVDFSDANLSDGDLSGADLSGADLSGADLSSADLSGVKLGGADLRDTELPDANLEEATLTDAKLGDASLANADLGGTDLRGAELSGADLSGANLGADLSGANLSGANLTDAALWGDLSSADLSGAKGVTNQELKEQASSLENATMPNGQKYNDRLLLPAGENVTAVFEPTFHFEVGEDWRYGSPEATDQMYIWTRQGRGELIVTNPSYVTVVHHMTDGRIWVSGDPPPENADEWVSWFQKHPNLDTSKPITMRVGNATGKQIDVTDSSTPESYPQSSCGEKPCVPLYGGSSMEVIVSGGSKDRFAIVDVGGETVVINVAAPTDKFDEFLPKAQKVLDSIEWEGG